MILKKELRCNANVILQDFIHLSFQTVFHLSPPADKGHSMLLRLISHAPLFSPWFVGSGGCKKETGGMEGGGKWLGCLNPRFQPCGVTMC